MKKGVVLLHRDFGYFSGGDLTSALKDKIIYEVKTPDDSMDDMLIIEFYDGSSLHIHYDYIYEWKLKR